MLALKPERGKPAFRNFREGDGNGGIIRSPLRAIALPDSREMYSKQGADVVPMPEGNIDGCEKRASIGLCEVLDPCMLGNFTCENREALPTPDTKQ